MLHLNPGAHRDTQVKHEQRHRDGKDTITERSKAFQALSSDRMVVG